MLRRVRLNERVARRLSRLGQLVLYLHWGWPIDGLLAELAFEGAHLYFPYKIKN